MNIIRFLKNQHQEVKDVLNEIIVRNDASESRSLLEKMSKMLRLHMQIEETIVYPAASRCFQGDLTETICSPIVRGARACQAVPFGSRIHAAHR